MESYELIYTETFDLKKIRPADKKEILNISLKRFPVAAAIILHIITLGIFTLIYYGIQHSKFPRIKSDDFGTGKAIGFMFIPFFNLYWIFMFWLRLVDRINLQLRLRNNPNRVPRALLITAAILTVISLVPFLGIITGVVDHLIISPISIGFIQSNINTLAASAKPA